MPGAAASWQSGGYFPYRSATLGNMADHRTGPDRDRILVAQLTGTAGHHARWRELTGDEEAAAVSELRELANGRADLLAEVAGILEGASEGELNEPIARQSAWLCRKAGADPEAIPAWIEEGRRRKANASPAAVLRPALPAPGCSVTAAASSPTSPLVSRNNRRAAGEQSGQPAGEGGGGDVALDDVFGAVDDRAGPAR